MAVPTGAIEGTSGQQGHEHKGFRGRTSRAAAAMVQKQKFLGGFGIVGCGKQKNNSLKMRHFMHLFFFKWSLLSEQVNIYFITYLATHETREGLMINWKQGVVV